MSHLRLFIAFDSSPEVKSKAGTIQDQLRQAKADVSWERQEKLHCTIKFLGDTSFDLVPTVIDALTKIGGACPTFQVRYSGTGCFPNKRDPRVLWLGIENLDGRLNSLFQSIDAEMVGLGFRSESHPFHPHLTLGRIRSGRNQGNLLKILENVTFDSTTLDVHEIQLIKSELKPTGSVYTIIKSVPLVGY